MAHIGAPHGMAAVQVIGGHLGLELIDGRGRRSRLELNALRRVARSHALQGHEMCEREPTLKGLLPVQLDVHFPGVRPRRHRQHRDIPFQVACTQAGYQCALRKGVRNERHAHAQRHQGS